MKHYCIECKHLYNNILEECPRCKTPRDYLQNWELSEELNKLTNVAYARGRNDYKENYKCPLCDGLLHVNKFNHYIECDGSEAHKFSHTGSRHNQC